MGAGPSALLRAGLAEFLRAAGHDVSVEWIDIDAGPLTPEPRFLVQLASTLAGRVRAAGAAGRFPIVLSGSCYAAIGITAGLDDRGLGVVWFDSHADFNTPDTTTSGFLDGMTVSMLEGACWAGLTREITGFCAVPDRDVLLVGARDLDPHERHLLERSRTVVLPPSAERDRLTDHVRSLASRVDGVYVHLDLDVLDPAEARANALAAPDGLTVQRTVVAISTIGSHLPIRAAALTAYDPAFDPDRAVCRAAQELAVAVLEAATAPPTGPSW